MEKIDTLIISDVHCGLKAARVEAAEALVSERNFTRLILLGDILHTTNLRLLRPRDFRFLKRLREAREDGIEVVWVAGNHDWGLSELKTFLGIPVMREYAWEEGGVKNLALHGDTLYDFTKETGLLGLFYPASEWVFLWGGGRKVARIFKNTFVTRDPSNALRERALALGKERNVRRIFCGHTHIELRAERDGVEYWNSGSWVDEPSPYIAITDGKVEIRYA